MTLREIANSIKASNNPEQQARAILPQHPELLPYIHQHLHDAHQIAIDILAVKPELTRDYLTLISKDEAKTFAKLHLNQGGDYPLDFIFYVKNNLIDPSELKYWATDYANNNFYQTSIIQEMIAYDILTIEDIQSPARNEALKQADYIRKGISSTPRLLTEILYVARMSPYEIIQQDWTKREDKKYHAHILKLYVNLLTTEQLANLALQEITYYRFDKKAIQHYREHLPEINSYLNQALKQYHKQELKTWLGFTMFFITLAVLAFNTTLDGGGKHHPMILHFFNQNIKLELNLNIEQQMEQHLATLKLNYLLLYWIVYIIAIALCLAIFVPIILTLFASKLVALSAALLAAYTILFAVIPHTKQYLYCLIHK